MTSGNESRCSVLARWERKLKLARTKVKKLTARVRYYERKGALPPGQE